jgi:hypothetical protein
MPQAVVRQYIYPMRMRVKKSKIANMIRHFDIMQTDGDRPLDIYTMFVKKSLGLPQRVANQVIVSVQAEYIIDWKDETVTFNSGAGLPTIAEQYHHEYVSNKTH